MPNTAITATGLALPISTRFAQGVACIWVELAPRRRFSISFFTAPAKDPELLVLDLASVSLVS